MNTYTLHINGYDIAFFGAIFISITLMLLLWFTTKANRFLAMALAVAFLWMARLVAIDIGLTAYLPYWSRLPLQFSLLLGPFIYFYVVKITRPNFQFKYKHLLHFSPLMFELGAHALKVSDSIKTGLTTYQTPAFEQLSTIVHLTAFVSVAVYIYLSHGQILHFYRQQKFNSGDRYRNKLRWLHRLLIAFGLLWLLWLPLTLANSFYYHYPQVYNPLYLLLMLMMIWMAARAFLGPQISMPPAGATVLKPLLPAELKQKGNWLKRTMQTGGYYQDPELSLSSLAEKLEMSPHELSRIINTVLKKSFNDFVNEYRVAGVVQKMRDPAYNHITLLGIAFESGFNSKTTFNRTFKQITGKSPAEYKDHLKKESPYYNLGRTTRFAAVNSMHDTTVKWSHKQLNRNFMFKNYFKIAWRNLTRNKSYAAINVTGLAVGIAVCMVIFIIIQYQTSFDSFHPKKDRIYRVLTEYHHAESSEISYAKNVPFQMPTALPVAFPQLEQVAPVYASHNDELQVIDANGTPLKNFKERNGVFYTSPSFFNMFNFPLLEGSYASLKDPNNVLLTKEIAETYFGDWKAAMGKTIKITGYYNIGAGLFQFPATPLKVSGILATIPANSDFQLKLVVAYGTDFTGDKQYGFQQPIVNASAPDFGCYVLLPPNVTAAGFNEQLSAYAKKTRTADNKDSYVIQPISDVHYDAEAGNYSKKTISHQLINVLWLIAAFILLIACVNFINLSTAQAVNRAKEVGVRKVLGSNKAQLQIQFIIETFLIVTFAVILAAGISLLVLPSVNKLLELSLSFNIFNNPAIITFLLIVTIVVTALAGFYPAMVLSGFNPINALKNKLSTNTPNGFSLRRGLVTFQFIIAQVLIIGTLIIVQQMNFFIHQPLGFDKDAIVNVSYRPGSGGEYLKQQLLQINGVKAASFSSNSPVEDDNNMFTTLKFDNAIKDADFKAITKFADEDYVPAYKLKLVAGRNLQPSGWTREFLVNEAFVKSLGLKKPEDILNKEVNIMGGLIKCPVVGVVKDFNNRSFRNDLAPLLIATNNTMYRQVSIKLSTTNIASTMGAIEKIWKRTFPDYVYEYQFLDDKIASFYKQENQLAALYKIFAAIAIFLSCLGLYGLASFMAVQRIKEVGIRKVLGATAGSIVYLFSKEFIILIAIAFAVATPIAWYCMHQWLQYYVYRISISWWLFVMGGLAAVIIALTTISFQAIRSATANPVKSLRSE